jgi:hypothetical protein
VLGKLAKTLCRPLIEAVFITKETIFAETAVIHAVARAQRPGESSVAPWTQVCSARPPALAPTGMAASTSMIAIPRAADAAASTLLRAIERAAPPS